MGRRRSGTGAPTADKQGELLRQECHGSADFDPFHLQTQEQSWPLVEGNGGRVAVMSSFRGNNMGAGTLSALIDRTDGARLCTVTCTSQAGHKITQEVNLPNPYEYTAVRQARAEK